MTLSRLATVSTDVSASLDRIQPKAPPRTLAGVLCDALFSGPEGRLLFEKSLDPAALAEWRALVAEQDPKIFFSDVVNFGLRLENSGQTDAAARLFASVTAFLEQAPESLTGFRTVAQKNYLALTNRGPLGPRAERLLDKFCEQATDPAALIAMGVAGPLFRTGRLWTAARFSRASAIPEVLAYGGGFVAETAGFTLTHKAVASALGHRQDWSPSALAREWASGATVLGSLKLAGEASRLGLRGYVRTGSLPHLAQEIGVHGAFVHTLPQVALFGGVLLGHRLQETFGFRERSDGATLAAEGLATLLHLHVGGALVAKVLGAGAHRSRVESELRLANWRQPPNPSAQTLGPQLQTASASPLFHTHYRDPLNRLQPLRMEGEGRSGGTPPPHLWTPEKMKQAIDFLVGRLPLPLQHAMSGIFNSEIGQLKMGYTLSRHTFADRKAHEAALFRLGYAIKHAQAGKSEGSYVDWLLRTVFEDIFDKLDSERADRILHFLAEGGGLGEFEAMLAKELPPLRLNRFAAWLPEPWKVKNPNYALIQTTPLPQDLRNILFRLSHTQAQAKVPSRYFQPEGELLEAITAYQWNRMGLIREVLEAAARSPLGILRLKRMAQILRDPDVLEEFIDPKLKELADPDFAILGNRHATLSHSRFRSPPSQFNAYLGGEAPEALLHEIQKRLPDLLDPQRASVRAQRRKDHLKMLENQHGRLGKMEQPLLATAFELLGDPYSKKISKALKNNEFDLRVLPDGEFESECRRLSARIEPEKSSAQFFPAGHGRDRGVMLVRQRPFDYYSSEVAPDALFTVMGKIAHEFQHYLDMHPKIFDTPRNRLVVEMSAHLRDALWKAEHGETGKLESYSRDGIAGLALHFRNEFEQIYAGIYKQAQE